MYNTACINCGAVLFPGDDICPACKNPITSGRIATASPVINLPTTPPQGIIAPPTSAPIDNTSPVYRMLGNLFPLDYFNRQQGGWNFNHHIRCPFCNAKFYPGYAAIYSDRQNNKGEHILLKPAPQDMLQRILARLRTETLDGEVYAKEGARRECPNPACRRLLPRHFEDTPSLTIAVIGDTVSGKTHFITTLLRQLKSGEAVQQGNVLFRFRPLTDATTDWYKKNERQLFTERKELPLTQRHSQLDASKPVIWEPIIFSLEIGYRLNIGFRRSVVNLVFYDVSGEDIVRERELRFYGWPILGAQGIIHIADPLSMPNILKHKDLRPGPQVEKAIAQFPYRRKSAEILSDVMNIFMQFNNTRQQQTVDTPVAIMLSKSDLLDSIVQQPLRFLQYPMYDGTVNINEMNVIDNEVKYLLHAFGEDELYRQSQVFSKVKFFATSTTGCALEADETFPQVKPRRCLDPFFWLLWELTSTRLRR